MKLFLKFRYFTVLGLCCVMLVGCAKEAKGEVERYRLTNEAEKSGYGTTFTKREQSVKIKSFEVRSSDEKQHENSTFSYRSDIANAVASVDGVADARVFITDKNTYVALVLDSTGRGMVKSAPAAERDISHDSKYGTSEAIGQNPFHSYMSVDDSNQLSDNFKQAVADTVKMVEPEAQNIHISASRDFIFYMDEFAQIAWGNRPLEPWLEHFNILVKHQFGSGKIMPQSIKQLQNNQQ